MKWNKANLAGLTSPEQQSEMKSILAGTWPALKPLPVFKYETEEYRATISFDRKRGEWVCRKTSLPSNEVQELRGGLREITMALPHGETETLIGDGEQPEQELEKDAHRRFQAIREWREKYENGARYFELRDFLSDSQRTELDDSLRMSLTARQLQFNSRNAANVFDDLAVAGGRFAALIELAQRSKASQGTTPQAQGPVQGEEVEPEAERAANDEHSLEVSSPEFGAVFSDNNSSARLQESAERYTDAHEFPALSIKNVFSEQDQPFITERVAHAASQQLEIENTEITDTDSSLVPEPRDEEGDGSPALSDFEPQVQRGHSFAEPIEGSSSRFPALTISAFQVNVFAILLLFAATAFTVGLTVGRGPVGKRLREPPQSLIAADAKPPTLPDQPDQADESSSRTLPPPVAGSDDSASAKNPDDATPSEEKYKNGTPTAGARGSESTGGLDSAEARSADSNSSPTREAKPSVKPEVSRPELNSEYSGAIRPVPHNVLPPASAKLIRRPKVVSKAVRSMRHAPRSPTLYRRTSTISAAPHLVRTSTILVTVPDRESQPFRVSFPNKTIAATSSLAITSQLSVLVFPEPGPSVTHKSARLEAGELLSFGWPRYSEPKGRYGVAETIRVRATIGQLGQVQEVKFLSGSASLLRPTMEAIHQWRYAPTLLDKRPVQAQQDITIEFRPPQYSSQLSTQHPPHD